MKTKIAVFASGTGSNFKALVQGDTGDGEIKLLLTDNKDAGALALAETLGIEAFYKYPGKFKTKFSVKEEQNWVDFLIKKNIQLICLAGLMRIIKGPLLEEFQGRILNIHPSLLPSFPGLDGAGQAFRYGVKIAGCTVHYVDKGTDTGPIIFQEAVQVLDTDNRDSLAARILKKEHELFSKAVKAHCSGRAVYSMVNR